MTRCLKSLANVQWATPTQIVVRHRLTYRHPPPPSQTVALVRRDFATHTLADFHCILPPTTPPKAVDQPPPAAVLPVPYVPIPLAFPGHHRKQADPITVQSLDRLTVALETQTVSPPAAMQDSCHPTDHPAPTQSKTLAPIPPANLARFVQSPQARSSSSHPHRESDPDPLIRLLTLPDLKTLAPDTKAQNNLVPPNPSLPAVTPSIYHHPIALESTPSTSDRPDRTTAELFPKSLPEHLA